MFHDKFYNSIILNRKKSCYTNGWLLTIGIENDLMKKINKNDPKIFLSSNNRKLHRSNNLTHY